MAINTYTFDTDGTPHFRQVSYDAATQSIGVNAVVGFAVNRHYVTDRAGRHMVIVALQGTTHVFSAIEFPMGG